MRVIRITASDKALHLSNTAVAIGVFDGLHRGHRLIIQSAVAHARKARRTSAVLTFWPHPHQQEILYSLAHRLRLLKEMGVQVCVIVKFDKRFARISAEDFVREIVFGKLGARAVFVGENFRFGQKARGDALFLAQQARASGVAVRLFKTVRFRGKAVSSSLIRRLISTGQLDRARALLLRRVSVLGTVIRGSSLGRMLGFPTANIEAHLEVLPPPGVYAVQVFLGRRAYQGACYIGSRPTFASRGPRAGALCANAQRRIEVHIFNFRKDIYGQDLEVQFIKKIRSDKKFTHTKALVQQIEKDITRIKAYFSRP